MLNNPAAVQPVTKSFLAHEAVAAGDLQQLSELSKIQPSSLQVRGNHGETIAHIAACLGMVDVLSWLQRNHPELIVAVDSYGQTIAHRAVHYEQTDVLGWLKRYAPAQLLGVDKQNRSIAHIAFARAKINVVEWMRLNIPTVLPLLGESMLEIAAESGGLAALASDLMWALSEDLDESFNETLTTIEQVSIYDLPKLFHLPLTVEGDTLLGTLMDFPQIERAIKLLQRCGLLSQSPRSSLGRELMAHYRAGFPRMVIDYLVAQAGQSEVDYRRAFTHFSFEADEAWRYIAEHGTVTDLKTVEQHHFKPMCENPDGWSRPMPRPC